MVAEAGRLARLWAGLARWRWGAAAAALAGGLLTAPSCESGWTLDDHLLRVALDADRAPSWSSPEVARAAHEGFGIGPRSAAEVAAWVERGVLPWWTDPGARLGLWQPLASWSHALELRLGWGPWWMHGVNVLLYMALVLAVAGLYRSMAAPATRDGVVPGGVWWGLGWAGAAAWVYALADGHGLVVGWISQRSLLLAALAATGAVWAHLRWVRQGWRPGAVWSALMLGAGLLASEQALGAVAYAVACALTLDRRPWRDRAAALLPMGAVAAAYAVGLRAIGAPGLDSPLSLSPWSQPVAFALALPHRAAALVYGQWGIVPSDLWLAVPPGWGYVSLVAGTAVILALIGRVLWPLLREDALARFWLLGASLAMVPACVVYPTDRVLLVVGLGGCGLIAQGLGGLARGERWAKPPGSERIRGKTLLVSWGLTHVLLPPVLLPVHALAPGSLNASFEDLARALGDAPELAESDVIVVRAPDSWSASMTPLVRASLGMRGPQRLRVLSAGAGGVEVTRRVGAQVDVCAARGFFDGPLEQLLVRPGRVDAAGAEVAALSDVRVTVAEVGPQGRPRCVRYAFDGALDAPSRRWWVWRDGAFVPFELPPEGATVRLAPAGFVGAPGRAPEEP